MAPRTRIVNWNGRDVPAELHKLPAGRYVIEAVDDEAPHLSSAEEAGIEGALESYRQGRVVDAGRTREIIALVSRITAENRHDETEWRRPDGDETS